MHESNFVSNFHNMMFCMFVFQLTALPTIPPDWFASDNTCFVYHFNPFYSEEMVMTSELFDGVLHVNAVLSSDALLHSCHLKIRVEDYIKTDAFSSVNTSGSSSDFTRFFKDLPALVSLYEMHILNKLTSSIQTTAQRTSTRTSATATTGSSMMADENQDNSANSSFAFVPPHVEPVEHNHNPAIAPRFGLTPTSIGDDGDSSAHPFRQPRGDFDGDLDPLRSGRGAPFSGGNLMGPQNFPGRFGGGRGSRPQSGMAPRFDPYGPVPGMGEPDFNHLPPPGSRPQGQNQNSGMSGGRFGGGNSQFM